MKFLFVFLHCLGLQKWPPGPREKGLPPLPGPVLGGPICPPLRSKELGLNLRKKRDLFLGNHPGVGRQPRTQPTTQLPGQEASSSHQLHTLKIGIWCPSELIALLQYFPAPGLYHQVPYHHCEFHQTRLAEQEEGEPPTQQGSQGRSRLPLALTQGRTSPGQGGEQRA